MAEEKGLEIMCIYCTSSGKSVPYNNIINKLDILDQEDYCLGNFWASLGGFSITIEGFKTIFSSVEFYNMLKASSFLLNTLYWLDEKSCDWFNHYLGKPELTIVIGIDKIFSVKNLDSIYLSISYKKLTKKSELRRGEHLFESVTINKHEWKEACKKALHEYYLVLVDIVNKSANSAEIRMAKEFETILSAYSENIK